jgi:hypothetical protein
MAKYDVKMNTWMPSISLDELQAKVCEGTNCDNITVVELKEDL